MEFLGATIIFFFGLLAGFVLGYLFWEKKAKQQTTVPGTTSIDELKGSLEAKLDTIKKDLDNSQQKFQDFQRILIGTQSRGKAGEQLLESYLKQFIRNGIVETNVTISGIGRVEFAWKLKDGKYLPIDSKCQDLSIVEKLSATSDTEEQKRLKKEIEKKVKTSIDDVKKYQSALNTSRICILAVPDSIYELAYNMSAEALAQGIILTNYSNCAMVAYIYAEQYNKECDKRDEKELLEKISATVDILNNIAKKSETIANGITQIHNANEEIAAKTAKAKRLLEK